MSNLSQERRYAASKRISLDHLAWTQKNCKTEQWTPEQIEAHLAKIGPDKDIGNWKERQERKRQRWGQL